MAAFTCRPVRSWEGNLVICRVYVIVTERGLCLQVGHPRTPGASVLALSLHLAAAAILVVLTLWTGPFWLLRWMRRSQECRNPDTSEMWPS